MTPEHENKAKENEAKLPYDPPRVESIRLSKEAAQALT